MHALKRVATAQWDPMEWFIHARASPKQCGPFLRVAEHAGLQPCVAERAARVEPLHQADEVGMALVERSDCRCVRVEDLAPVRARLERGQGILDLGDHLAGPRLARASR